MLYEVEQYRKYLVEAEAARATASTYMVEIEKTVQGMINKYGHSIAFTHPEFYDIFHLSGRLDEVYDIITPNKYVLPVERYEGMGEMRTGVTLSEDGLQFNFCNYARLIESYRQSSLDTARNLYLPGMKDLAEHGLNASVLIGTEVFDSKTSHINDIFDSLVDWCKEHWYPNRAKTELTEG